MTMSDVNVRSRVSSPVTASLSRLLRGINAGLAARRSRLELARLGEPTLHDLGLTRGDIETALAGPWWRAINFRSLEQRRRQNRLVQRRIS
jgi:uncharacterized protein YjiS (DUF1127 family)